MLTRYQLSWKKERNTLFVGGVLILGYSALLFTVLFRVCFVVCCCCLRDVAC